jgi:glycosyltransferase involved in cell wall biosynthesis
MRIAMIADRLVMGGLETHIITTVNELLQRGHSILLNAAYIAPEILSQIKDPQDLFKHTEWTANAVDDLVGFNPDIIHSHPFTAIFRGFEAAQTLQKPFVITMHGLYDFGLDRSALGNQVCERVNAIIAVDHRVADLLTGCISHPEKITVIYNGIDTAQFYPISINQLSRLNYGLNFDWLTLVVVSRMADGKERPIFQLLECLPELLKCLSGLNILIVGGGCCFSVVQERVENIGQNEKLGIKMVGQQYHVANFLAMADLALACDRAALEAMACQRAVLAMNAAGFAGVIDYSNYRQILLNRGGYRTFTNTELVKTILGILQNKAIRQKLATDGLKIVRRYFNIKQTVDQLESVYYRARRRTI